MLIVDLPADIEKHLLTQGCAHVTSQSTGQELIVFSPETLNAFIMALSDDGFKQSVSESLNALKLGNTESIDVENDELFKF